MLVDFTDLAWGWMRLMLGPRALRREPGLRFAKVLGSGHDGRFGLRPSASRQGLFCVFDNRLQASRFIDASPTLARYREHAGEICSVLLHPYSSRGSWAGATLPVSTPAPASGPVAVLTRAAIRPSRSWHFWRHAPAAQRALHAAPGCLLAAGLGEAPLLRQATFSLWNSVADMEAYAHHGAHLAAIQASRQGGHFSESMFVRFVPEALRGHWQGRHFD